jgi:hypothetical protein
MIKHNWSPHGSEEAMRIQGKESNKDYHWREFPSDQLPPTRSCLQIFHLFPVIWSNCELINALNVWGRKRPHVPSTSPISTCEHCARDQAFNKWDFWRTFHIQTMITSFNKYLSWSVKFQFLQISFCSETPQISYSQQPLKISPSEKVSWNHVDQVAICSSGFSAQHWLANMNNVGIFF